ncbi:MAG: hypothetical protein FWG99_09280 [Treponema sp.]|nr:hypothetical protein [Treponema sp.]
MKVKRKTLLAIVAGLGVFLIIFSVIRHFTGFPADEALNRYITDGIIIAALCIFIYNRKMAKEEKLAEEAKRQDEEDGTISSEENNQP